MVTVMDTDIWGLAILYVYVLNDNNANLITFLKIITYLMGEQFLHRCKKKEKAVIFLFGNLILWAMNELCCSKRKIYWLDPQDGGQGKQLSHLKPIDVE